MTRTLRKAMIAVLSVCATLILGISVVMLGACGKPKLYTLTFETNGGNKIEPIKAEAGTEITPPDDPIRDDYTFDGWYLTKELTGDKATLPTVMPAKNITYYAKWESGPVAQYEVKVFKLNFVTYDEYVEDTALAKTKMGKIGSVVTGEAFVPEHYTLNTARTQSVEVTESGDAVLYVYVDPVYTRYSDVFESTDLMYALETEPSVLYLDRIELGRKPSTSYNAETGAFEFETDGDFVLEGKVSGEYFYYYRDTVEKTFGDYAGTDATLEIKSASEVVYTDAQGSSLTGSYSVNVENGRYVFTSGTTQFEFVLVSYYGVLTFRTSDGTEGYYAYDGELQGGGWALLRFDGFGTVTYVEDTGATYNLDYEYLGNSIVDMYDFGIAKLVTKTSPSLGGYNVKGVFVFTDDLRGEYVKQNGRRIETLILDGFGDATITYYTDEGVLIQDPTFGTYELVMEDEAWYVKSGSSITTYAGINSHLQFTASNATVTNYILYYSADQFGNVIPSKFEELKPALLAWCRANTTLPARKLRSGGPIMCSITITRLSSTQKIMR